MQAVIQALRDAGSWLVPAMLSAEGIGLLWILVKSWWKNKGQKKNNNLIIELLTTIATKDTCSEDVKTAAERLETLTEKLEKAKDTLQADDQSVHNQLTTIAQMIGIIFEQSSLPLETKERLRALKTKVEFATDVNIVEKLLAENANLQTRLDDAKVALEEEQAKNAAKVEVADETVQRSEQVVSHTIIQ